MHFFAFITFLLTVLPIVVLACPPPFNNIVFIGNETHSSSELIEDALARQGIGWVEGVSEVLGNPTRP